MRLVTTGKPDAAGVFKGAVIVDLAPGWKTYWRDPGDAGVPPQIDFTGSRNVSVVKIGYPPPQHFRDDSGVWAGYKKPVRFALTLKEADLKKPMRLDARIFIGVCQSICVPFQAHFSIDPTSGADDLMDAAAVAETFKALPAHPSKDFSARVSSVMPQEIRVSASVPDPDKAADLFVAAPEGYSFGAPKQMESHGGKAQFAVPVIGKPAGSGTKDGVAYTLVQGKNAVSGRLTLSRPE